MIIQAVFLILKIAGEVPTWGWSVVMVPSALAVADIVVILLDVIIGKISDRR
jgi:hypothetical protein